MWCKGLLNVVQSTLWPPQGPGEGAPEPSSARLSSPAPGPTRGETPARGPLPDRPPVPPSYEELFPEYASSDRAPTYHVPFPNR